MLARIEIAVDHQWDPAHARMVAHLVKVCAAGPDPNDPRVKKKLEKQERQQRRETLPP